MVERGAETGFSDRTYNDRVVDASDVRMLGTLPIVVAAREMTLTSLVHGGKASCMSSSDSSGGISPVNMRC